MLYTDLVLGAKQHAFSKVTFQQILENTLLFKFSRSLSEIRRQFVRKKKLSYCQKCWVVTNGNNFSLLKFKFRGVPELKIFLLFYNDDRFYRKQGF